MNAVLNPHRSVNNPYKGGTNAPPAIAVQRIPEPCGFASPKSSIEIAKIVGNIIELNNPTARIAHMETNPDVSIDRPIKHTARKANKLRMRLGEKTPVRKVPANRPTIAPPQ